MFCERALLFELSYLLRTINAVEHRHLPVHQYDIQVLARTLSPPPVSGSFEIVESFETVIGNGDMMSFRSELLTQHSCVDLVVLDK